MRFWFPSSGEGKIIWEIIGRRGMNIGNLLDSRIVILGNYLENLLQMLILRLPTTYTHYKGTLLGMTWKR